jgi:thiol-disulfide isomerase/thioredoxin
MKNLLVWPALFITGILAAQDGYEIKVTLKPFKNQQIYLGHYSGKQFPVVDSARLNDRSEGVFRGKTQLGGGIYFIVYPTRDKFIEILIDKQQHFSVLADTANLPASKKFINSPDNDLFDRYQRYMNTKGKAIDSANAALKSPGKPADTVSLKNRLQTLNREITGYREQIMTKNPASLLSMLLHMMGEPEIPPAAKHPGGKYDSTFAYQYFKNHYWDGINFWDERICRTPSSLFEDRLDKYFNTLVAPAADSVIKELDWMLGYASVSKELTRFLLVKFITRYLNMKYMWEDAVFVHLFQKYFADKDYDWLTPQGKKIISDRGYSLMANIMGNQAENVSLADTAGVIRNLYSDTSNYTLVCFWDPLCGHCKETLPVLDSMYRAKWKAKGLKIYAIAKEVGGTRKDWLDFIHAEKLEEWINVYYSRNDEKARIDANIPSYSQLYDVQTFPTLFLLDKNKRIIAKKLSWQQADEILDLRGRQP